VTRFYNPRRGLQCNGRGRSRLQSKFDDVAGSSGCVDRLRPCCRQGCIASVTPDEPVYFLRCDRCHRDLAAHPRDLLRRWVSTGCTSLPILRDSEVLLLFCGG
jgi:hypothetical protein